MRSHRRGNEDSLSILLVVADKKDDGDNDADEDEGTKDTTNDCPRGWAWSKFSFLFWGKERAREIKKMECLWVL